MKAKKPAKLCSISSAAASAPGASYGDFAILFRTNEHCRPFEVELRKRKAPYVLVGASSFFDRKEVKDLTAYMRAAPHPTEDTAVLRILNTPRRGIGSQTIESIRKHAVQRRHSVWETLQDQQFLGELPVQAAKAAAGFTEVLDELGQRLRGRTGRARRCKS